MVSFNFIIIIFYYLNFFVKYILLYKITYV